MAPRKRSTNHGTSNDGEFEAPEFSLLGPTMAQTVSNINTVRLKREGIRKDIEADLIKRLEGLKKKTAERHRLEHSKKVAKLSSLLDRLASAVQKRAASEEAVLKLIATVSQDSINLASLMNAVHRQRKQAALAASKYKGEEEEKIQVAGLSKGVNE